MKKLFALAAIAAVSLAPAHAVVVTQWNFNSVTPDANLGTGTLVPSVGTGTASLAGGVTALTTFASGAANGGSSDPATSDDTGWQTTNYAAQGAGDKSRGVQFLVNTTGMQNVVVSWDQRLSNTASRWTQFQYTINGTNFLDASGGLGLFSGTAGDTWYNNRTVDLSAVAGVNNNANFGFRIVATFAPSTSVYQGAAVAGTYAATGTNRFDMVTVSAAPIPEPETYALMLAGLAAVGLIARRRQA